MALSRRRHKVVRDLEWAWTSPNIFSSRGAGSLVCPAGLPDATCAGVAASASCQKWLEILDADPAPLVSFLVEEHGHESHTALGFYFAQLLEFWLRACPSLGVESLHTNRPIKVGGSAQTVGQLKYLFRRPAFPGLDGPVRLHHWEASVKYFLRAAPDYDEVAHAAAPGLATAVAAVPPPMLLAHWAGSTAGSTGDDEAAPEPEPEPAQQHSVQDGRPQAGGAVRRAAGGTDLAALAALIEGWSGADLNACVDGSGKSPLHQAAWRGDPRNVVLLLDRGAHIEAISTGEFSFGKTPVFFAITRSRDEVVSLLLERGASVRIINNKGQTPLSLGTSHLRPETLRQLADHEEAEVVPWRNYRLSHSDGLVYGDLDPRFLEHLAEPSDVVTPLVVNPTTKLSRKGNFDRNNLVATAETPDAVAPLAAEDADKDRRSCLGLYVGPSLHENLAWRVTEAQRKMKLAQPGGAGYAWLARESGLLAAQQVNSGPESDPEPEPEARPDSAFICKGYLFEALAEPSSSTKDLEPAPGVSDFCGSVSASHLQGWWCEWPVLKKRFEAILSTTSSSSHTDARWAVLTKRHWLAPAVARPQTEEGTTDIVVEGEAAIGIEALPTFSTAQIATQLLPHFEAIATDPAARPQPLLLAHMQRSSAGDGTWVELSRGFVVVEGWTAQAAPMVSDGVPLVRKERDGRHDTMIAPQSGGVTTIRRSRKDRQTKRKPEPPPAVVPPELEEKRGAEAVAVLRGALGRAHAGGKAGRSGRKTRGDRELWRRQLVALLMRLGVEDGFDAAVLWLWECLSVLEAMDKSDRAVSALLLDALSDTVAAALPLIQELSDSDSADGAGLELAGVCLRELCAAALFVEKEGSDAASELWTTGTRVRFVLEVVGQAAKAADDDKGEATTAERWSAVLLAAGGAAPVARAAEALIGQSSNHQTELESAARLAAKPGVASAMTLPIIEEVGLSLLKKGSVKLLSQLLSQVTAGDAFAGERLQTELLMAAPPKTAQRLAAQLGVEWVTSNIGTTTASGSSARRDSDGTHDKPSQPYLGLPAEMIVRIATTAEECQAAVRELMASLPASNHVGGAGAIGLDTEWADSSGAGPGGAPRPACVLLQIASARHCVLVRLDLIGAASLQERCSELTALLADADVAKSGVGVGRDAALLAKEWGLVCNSTVELSQLALGLNQVKGLHGVGLASLARLMLGRDLQKTHSLRCGDWRAEPLSPEQVEYAALDAVAGQQILAALFGKGDSGDEGVVDWCRRVASCVN